MIPDIEQKRLTSKDRYELLCYTLVRTMSQFTQKYTIIQLFDDIPVGTQYSSNAWPLHSTIVDTFAIDWDVPTMVEKLTGLLSNHPQASSVAADDRFFGDDGQVQVVLLERTDSLVALHYDVTALLSEGGLKLNDPQFAHEGFLPHSTVQTSGRLNKGDEVTFTALSIIDMFPDSDPYQRKVLATIPIAG